METHAEYHAQNPLPTCGVIFGRMADSIAPPKEGIGRVHKIPMGSVKLSKKGIAEGTTFEEIRGRYLKCLSKTRWMSSAEIAAAAGVGQTGVTKMMNSRYMKEATKMKNLDGHKHGWKLK